MIIARRNFVKLCTSFGIAGTVFPHEITRLVGDGAPITAETIACAEEIAGLTLTPEQRELLVEDLQEHLGDYEALRVLDLPNSVPSALTFDPRISGIAPPTGNQSLQWEPSEVARPQSDQDMAFLSVAELSWLLRTREVTSTELTELYLSRLKQYDGILKAVVTLTEDLAFIQAARADVELDAGIWRGPLHGVPYGAKDLLSTKNYPTTWGAVPYQDQVIDDDAAVITKLDTAGAVLVAKLALGALAWGDVWFGGMTRNPWNIDEGSSGSSAGPGAAVAAGLVGFAIGSETLGSIVSPSTRNGVTGHRPTFGLVSRHGAMTLSWSMDKLGPMARTALDCVLIFEAIRGADARDFATVNAPFPFNTQADLKQLRIGYLNEAFEEDYRNREADAAALEVLRGLGGTLTPMKLPDELPVDAMLSTLGVEAAAAFDTLTRSGGVDTMVRQGRNTWPHEFRTSRFVPAVEFMQGTRARVLLMRRMAEVMQDIDVVISPTFGGTSLRITNLTGHPCVTVPNAFHLLEDAPESPRRNPGSITFLGGLYKDAQVLQVAYAYQQATDFHIQRSPLT